MTKLNLTKPQLLHEKGERKGQFLRPEMNIIGIDDLRGQRRKEPVTE